MPTPPNVHIAPLSDLDIPKTFGVMSLSFGADAPFINAYFPAHATPAGRAAGGGGYCRDRGLDGEEGVRRYWPEEEDREWMGVLWRDYVKPRTGALVGAEGRGVYVLELLAVHPEYRRLGAGAALVNVGLKAAEEKGVDAIIESTDAGGPLYEKCGLKCEIERIVFDVGEQFGGKKTPKLCFMTKGAVAAS
ncbi:hypothetical protein PMIN01_07488 [Paraphaeosphaeria minitans]|uniref:N-acetyltransferase domain-containing protein n=1 Tax=Paraphaeosphaeria minitans TaxID=565426 RepID=A0A9P6GHN0_9PLEO|nr:hypothetical protein PMIN01_07488 [Paraphaeosphaeria minitans]